MTKTKDKPFDLDAEEPGAEDEELTEEEKEEILAEERHIEECVERAVEALVVLARVPSAGREQFSEAVSSLMRQTLSECALRDGRRSKAFVELERSIRAARVATYELTEWERAHLAHMIEERISGWDWVGVINLMSVACTKLTGNSPFPMWPGAGVDAGGVT
jgi:hypothetical protein